MRSRLLYSSLAAALEADKRNGYQIIKSKIAPNVVFALSSGRAISLKGYVGEKAVKPRFYYLFRSLAEAEAYAEKFAKEQAATAARRAQETAAKRERVAGIRAADFWTVGDVGTYQWGYDQTNTEWYQVVAVGAKTIKIRRLNENSKEDGFMSGRTQPRRGDFRDDKILTKRVGDQGRVSMDFGSLGKWDGKAAYWSSYA
jgi:hypothetical protein